MKNVWKKYSKNKMSVLGLVIILILLLLIAFADVYIGYDKVLAQDVKNKLQSPSLAHICGTDNLGRDLFARLVYGARVSLGIGVVATFVGMMIGCVLGAACAYVGGVFDNIIMRVLDILYCVPFVLQAMLIVAVLGASIPNLIFAVTVGNIPGYAKVTRGVVISITERDFVKAARVSGVSTGMIILKYIIPNTAGVLITNGAFYLADTLLVSSGLSFLGIGVQPPVPEWGSILSSGLDYLNSGPHIVILSGLFIALTTVGITLIGDGLRDVFEE